MCHKCTNSRPLHVINVPITPPSNQIILFTPSLFLAIYCIHFLYWDKTDILYFMSLLSQCLKIYTECCVNKRFAVCASLCCNALLRNNFSLCSISFSSLTKAQTCHKRPNKSTLHHVINVPIPAFFIPLRRSIMSETYQYFCLCSPCFSFFCNYVTFVPI